MSQFMRDASLWLVVSAGGAILVGVLFLQLFRSHAGVMTRITIGMQVSGAAKELVGRWELAPMVTGFLQPARATKLYVGVCPHTSADLSMDDLGYHGRIQSCG